MSFLKKLGIFAITGSAAFAFLTTVFWLNCVIGGHNVVEMFYGGAATYILSLATGIEFALLASYP